MRKEFGGCICLAVNIVFSRPEEKGRFFMDRTKQNKNKDHNSISLTKRLVGTAMFAALAYAVSFFEFPIFPATPFLKLDFSAVFLVLSAFLFGPICGVSACAVKEFLCFLTKTSTGGVGEIANFIVITGFILIPSVVYCFKKGLPIVIITLLLGCCVQVGLSLIVNRYINFPLFMGAGAKQAFQTLWVYVMFFNMIKSVTISVLTILLYKRISKIIKSI